MPGRPDTREYPPVLRGPLLPLRDIIVFPHMVVPLFVGRDRSVAALEAAMKKEKTIVVAAQRQARVNNPSSKDIHAMGTMGTIVQLLRLPDETSRSSSKESGVRGFSATCPVKSSFRWNMK